MKLGSMSALVSVGAAVISAAGAVWVGYFHYSGSTEVARIENEGAKDIAMMKFAVAILRDPTASPIAKYWALEVLGTWKGVSMSSERRKEIAEAMSVSPSTNSLEEVGNTFKEAKQLNTELEGVGFWQDVHTIGDVHNDNPTGARNQAPSNWIRASNLISEAGLLGCDNLSQTGFFSGRPTSPAMLSAGIIAGIATSD